MKRAWLSWSSGKDCAWALHVLRQQGDIEVVGLVTTTNAAFDRVAMHGVRRSLVEAQAEATGLPVHIVPLPWPCSNEVYETKMAEAFARALGSGVTHVAFGDLFLEDVRDYRIRQLGGTGLEPLFPVWGRAEDTLALARTMMAAGVQAIVTTVDPRQCPERIAGRPWDEALLVDMPPTVDPCGERGEFHTFCTHAPVFLRPIDVTVGEVLVRDGFCFADVVEERARTTAPAG